jgi:acylphosphatase
MEKEKKYFSLHLHVSGLVQGVGFRFYAINRARAYGVTGWVKNLYDGRVEIEAEGTRDRLVPFLEEMRIGPRSAHVRGVQEQWHEIAFSRYEGFTVGY